MWKKLIETDNDYSTLLMRIVLGAVFFPHGAQKALGWFGGAGFSATVEGFTKGGFFLPVTLLIIAGEFLGSLGLVVGFLGRVAAFGITCIMTGAIFMVHGKNGFFMNWFGNQPGEGYEYHLLALGLSLAILLRGSGRWSLDRLLSEKSL